MVSPGTLQQGADPAIGPRRGRLLRGHPDEYFTRGNRRSPSAQRRSPTTPLGHIAMTVYPLGSDEPFLAEVSEVARPRIGRALVVVPQVACRDDPKRADGGQRASLRAAQSVLAVPGVVDNLPVSAANQDRTCALAREPMRTSVMTFVSRGTSLPKASIVATLSLWSVRKELYEYI